MVSEPCDLAHSISELEDLSDSQSLQRGCEWCSYSLGERLFWDLFRNIDETTFRLAFRRLYLHTAFNIFDDECDEYPKSICHVEEAFPAYATDEGAQVFETVIDRWYDRPESFDPSWIQRVPLEPDIPDIHGRMEGASLSFSPDGPPLSNVAAVPNRNRRLFLNLDYSYKPSGRLQFLPIEVAIYYEDGFEINRS